MHSQITNKLENLFVDNGACELNILDCALVAVSKEVDVFYKWVFEVSCHSK